MVETLEQAREEIKEAFLDVYGKPTDWSIFADKFIEWVVENNFQLKTFDNFVEWMYYYNDDELEGRRAWDFFFNWGDLEDFASAFIEDEEERANFIKFVNQN